MNIRCNIEFILHYIKIYNCKLKLIIYSFNKNKIKCFSKITKKKKTVIIHK